MRTFWPVVLMTVIGLGAVGCATGHCRGRPDGGRRVFVAKPDGSKQCVKKAGASPEAMAGELKDIEIFSKENRSDGGMHMTVCNGPTGRVNVYEIREGDLPKAKALGFEEFPQK